jgi:dTDP-4-amino-4,6-dideoxygalactose transaminase
MHSDRPMPVADWWRGHLLSLPIHPGMNDEDVAFVATATAERLGMRA